MKKILPVILISSLMCLSPLLFSACKQEMRYSDYISEKRTAIYQYKDDDVEIKLYCGQKEQPFCADGIKGDVSDLTEIFVSLPKNPEELFIKVDGHEGEMNYQAVENNFYLSFSAPEFTQSSLEVNLTFDGESKNYTALNVKTTGVMSCEEAVKCASEYAAELFGEMTVNKIFNGEIFVRLLYDDGCYYYVGICGKDKLIHAYLIEGERGIVIAEKQVQA